MLWATRIRDELLMGLWDTLHTAGNSLSPRRRSGERARERGNPIDTALLSPALSSLVGGEGGTPPPNLMSSLSRGFISNRASMVWSRRLWSLAPARARRGFLGKLSWGRNRSAVFIPH